MIYYTLFTMLIFVGYTRNDKKTPLLLLQLLLSPILIPILLGEVLDKYADK